ncbi:MAG: thioredoxin [Leptolyngbya sp. SIO4C1]|nr:thioredoxin [Leptolyngbya sp. SIO4C1]
MANSSAAVGTATDATFETDVISQSVPVLVDFWAPWCGPCRMVGPVVEEVATQMGDQIKVVKLNVDDNTEVASRYGVRSIPTLIVFKGGEVVETLVGAVPATTLTQAIEKHL